MRRFISILLEPKTNGPETAELFSNLLGVKISSTTLRKEIEEHPDNPSLLSISDVLTTYGVENLTARISIDQLVNVPTPFITQIKGQIQPINFFTVVKRITAEHIYFFDPEKHLWNVCSLKDFSSRSSGIVLLAELHDNAGEKHYLQKINNEKRIRIGQNIRVFWLPAAAMAIAGSAIIQNGKSALLPSFFLLIALAGSILGVLLLLYELDQYNPVLQQICSAGKKVNCGAILESKAAKIAGISWSAIGFSYFMGSLLLLLLWGVTNPSALFTLAWLNLFAVPYIFFSVYYQMRIARQWCVLCLSVQGLLVLQLTTSIVAGWYTLLPLNLITVQLLIELVITFGVPFMVVNILFPALKKAKERNNINSELQKLKRNSQIFAALKVKQKKITAPTEGLGISIGNPNAKHHLVKVCSPYCSPCSKAHPLIEELLENNPDVRLQIIFNAFDNDGDLNTPPIKHLLAISEKESEKNTKLALDAWYMDDRKDYTAFAAKYPMNGELKQQNGKLRAMRDWCDKTEITFTPTFFIDGYQLPDIYTVTDLKYFLSV